ncbi:hypothetical protein NC651_039524 [Populus alba x Populus x berolinensis]|nr:hypothetical protein NC651_039524 [Populus alba x Populus x berolinensis]
MEGASFKICGRQASRVQITHCRVLMDQGLPVHGCVPLNEYNFTYRKQKQTIDI